jgi:uncharacterized protein HemX
MSNATPNGSNKTILWVLGFFVTAVLGAATHTYALFQSSLERIAVLEQRYYDVNRRLDAIEHKIDQLLERRSK